MILYRKRKEREEEEERKQRYFSPYSRPHQVNLLRILSREKQREECIFMKRRLAGAQVLKSG